MKIAPLIVITIFGLSLLGCNTLINQVAFHPDKVNTILEKDLPPGIQELSIITRDRVSISSLYLPLADSDKILIYFHGNAGNIYHRIPSLSILRGFGLNVIGVSYRGYGKSEGSPSEQGLYEDGEAVFKYVTEKLGFSLNNIIILGRSIGTTVAVNTAQHREIAGLILVSPLTSGKAQAKAGGLGLLSSLAGGSFDNKTKIKHTKAPLLIVHGTNDRVVPYSMGKTLFDSAQTKKQLITIEGAGHNNLQGVYKQAYWSSLFEFINDR